MKKPIKWQVGNFSYIVDKNIFIPEGVKFIVEPGTILKFNGCGIKNEGEMCIKGTPQKPIVLTTANGVESWPFITGNYNQLDVIEYCHIENTAGRNGSLGDVNCKNCIFYHPIGGSTSAGFIPYNMMYRCNIIEGELIDLQNCNYNAQNTNYGECNYVNNRIAHSFLPRYERMGNVNYFNNLRANVDGTILDQFSFDEWFSSGLVKPEKSSYLGTSKEDIANTFILDIDYDYGYAQADLSTILKKPISGAHGIVWKVVVDGTDPQDEYEIMPSIGVGRHRFDVYFNRPMNKSKVPQISFGVREPYTQHSVNENGFWDSDGTVYTAFVTITGKTQSDGVNRICVQGAEDEEFFEIPYEKTRFNINIQSAGSLATGFTAEPGLGRVNLTWNNENNDFEDAMGFNIYRYTIDADGKADTICINKEIVDIETTDYSDYNVTPGETYYYLYRVLSTDLKEFDVSNVVAATPLTSQLGDADGSGDVKVPDVITTVNYILGENPKPFIFEAADVNTDQNIDVLDVIGIIQIILNQPSSSRAFIEGMAQAVYTIEDGVLYIETPVELGGVQAQFNSQFTIQNSQFAAAETLKGFEVASSWLTENDYSMLAYSFGSKTLTPGKHAIMTIDNADITSLRLSDTQGNSVLAVPGDATAINDAMGSKVINSKGVWNLSGQKIVNSKSSNGTLPKGVYIINGEKVIK